MRLQEDANSSPFRAGISSASKKEVDDSPPPGNQVQLSAFGETSGILQAHSQHRVPHKLTGTESCQMFSLFQCVGMRCPYPDTSPTRHLSEGNEREV